ncbi:ATP-grasp domain-containing protein [Congregibacter litoralis]|uniref:RimK-like ATP-grasp domain protein n=1 Tax=Congregibacter litoralis KT71 TaxID=314285 RepID=A4A724_9GAMM|nr:alpha-L-glutamate ligase [Congregibacter litoralis]EAQ98093.1 RimK-like ATP-grasp domain protein [Congregibacter litoralis KT71]
MHKVHIIHENREWSAPLLEALDALGVAYEDWFLDEGSLDLSKAPPEGVFYNRMSASSHTRDHRFAPEYAAAVLAWLERHERRVLNPGRALQLELSKVAQYAALEAEGILTPRTIAVVGKGGLTKAAKEMGAPFITKHNRAGKGLGVRLFQTVEELESYVASDTFEEPIDGITLIQQYIAAPEPFITRCEFVGQEFVYAVRVDTSDGFLLCPADECQDEDATVCPATSAAKFEIIEDFDDAIIEDYRRMLIANNIHVAGIENIISADGKRYTYDINTNTNYNPRAEHKAGKSGMEAIARLLQAELSAIA